MNKWKRERYIRWQNYRINQLSFSINLFLGFSVASIAFVINMMLSEKVVNNAILSMVIEWFIASAVFGGIATVSRLLDFRYTASKIMKRSRCNSFMAKWCGPVTWGAFWGQVLTYSAGAYFFLKGVIYT